MHPYDENARKSLLYCLELYADLHPESALVEDLRSLLGEADFVIHPRDRRALQKILLVAEEEIEKDFKAGVLTRQEADGELEEVEFAQSYLRFIRMIG